MEATEIIALLTLIATALIGGLGGTFALLQWSKSNRIRRTEFVREIVERLEFDKELADISYILDYEREKWYNREYHGDKEKEQKFDSFFSYLTYICYLRKTKSLTAKEFTLFEYTIRRACSNRQAQAYLWNLHHWSKRNNTTSSFQYLIDYLREKVLDEERRANFDSDSVPNKNGYEKNLGF